jgi:hypothetical protein
MRSSLKSLPLVLLVDLVLAASARAQDVLPNRPPRPLNGQPVKAPPSVSRQNGVLRVGLTLKRKLA